MAPTLALESCRSDGNSNSNQQVRERLFEKVVTPSDVGKLNRLVVPKHFAEKHLPLLGAAARAGTVLCFHDARGGNATWLFRYSYWGSSQSYVMTKGWSRYVRDKRLAAGDTVSFCRDGARLYIDCRRSGKRVVVAAPPPPAQAASLLLFGNNTSSKAQQQHLYLAPPAVDVARRGRSLRLFGVDLMEPPLLDLQL